MSALKAIVCKDLELLTLHICAAARNDAKLAQQICQHQPLSLCSRLVVRAHFPERPTNTSETLKAETWLFFYLRTYITNMKSATARRSAATEHRSTYDSPNYPPN